MATLAILDAVPIKAVSEMLGHSSVAVTMSIYTHVMPDSRAQVANAMAKLLFSVSRERGSAEVRDKVRVFVMDERFLEKHKRWDLDLVLATNEKMRDCEPLLQHLVVHDDSSP